MTQKTTQDFSRDFDALLELQKRAFAPFAGFNQWGVTTYERAAKDFQQLATKQTQLATEFFGRQTERTNEWLKFAASAQADIGKWVETANEQIVSAVRRSAA